MISLLSYIPLVLLLNYLSQIPNLKNLFYDYIVSGRSILFPWFSSFKILEFTSRIGPTLQFSMGNLLDIIFFYNFLFNINGILFRFYTRVRYPEELNFSLLDINFFYYYQTYNSSSNKEEEFESEFLDRQFYNPVLIFKNNSFFPSCCKRFKKINFWKNVKFIRQKSSITLQYVYQIDKNQTLFHSSLFFIPNIKNFFPFAFNNKNHVHTIIFHQNELFSDLKKFVIELCEILFLVRNDFFMIIRKRIETINSNQEIKKYTRSLRSDLFN